MPRYGPVIVMNAPAKPSNVSVYVKDVSVSVPSRIRGSQLGLGQRASSNTVEGSAVSDGTVSRPFFGESSPVVTVSLNDCVCDSIGFCGFAPGLKQSTVAV